VKAFLYGFPIGMLGGLIGLGGAEFRLPVLTGMFRYKAIEAVPINLAISLLTVAAALTARIFAMPMEGYGALAPTVTVLTLASMMGAYVGTTYLYRMRESQLEKIIMALLAVIGAILVGESIFSFTSQRVVEDLLANMALEVILGLGIGLVSSLLGVAGGELIIPTLVLVFGIAVKEAGTASLLISLATMIVGFVRYFQRDAYANPNDVRGVILPMGIGSIAGAWVGGGLVDRVSSDNLKLLLGLILIASASKMFQPAMAKLHSEAVMPGRKPGLDENE
jgi:uncharacterized membrane protein YfcA